MNDQSHHGFSGHAEVLTKLPVYSVLADVMVEKHHEDQCIDHHSDDEDQTYREKHSTE